VSAIDLAGFRRTPLCPDPFDHLIVADFVRREALPALQADFPAIREPGAFPAHRLRYGPAFASLLAELRGPEVRAAFAEKFAVDLEPLPVVLTVRGRCGPRDGRIHTDLPGKVLTVLLYLNGSWDSDGGRLRLLRSADDLEDVAAEVPPVAGTLLAFRRGERSYHGHRPFVGERRVIQLNWVTRRHLWSLRREELMRLAARWWPGRAKASRAGA
jgi:hypothetical protein